jgi:hypothetical protein
MVAFAAPRKWALGCVAAVVAYLMELLTTRKPTRLWNPSGVAPLRFAERQCLAKWLQPPPRYTRYEPEAGPVGLVTLPLG